MNPPITLKELFDNYSQVIIPMIQRDYAQGRNSQAEVRDNFIASLLDQITKDHTGENPLVLDFIYGSLLRPNNLPGSLVFEPLDGQQRLTTLYLLHWIVAWKEGRLADFRATFLQDDRSRFSYSTRPSSTDFLNQLVLSNPPAFAQDSAPTISNWLSDQPWYFRHWRLDPTVQAALELLDHLQEAIADLPPLLDTLLTTKSISFYSMNLEDFGLSDKLYIKMNARGKPLTAFETFKAKLQEKIGKTFPDESFPGDQSELSFEQVFASKMDTVWLDFFWQRQAKRSAEKADESIINFLHGLALILVDPGDSENTLTILQEFENREPLTFTHFERLGLISPHFVKAIVFLLERWTSPSWEPFVSRAFDEEKLIAQLLSTSKFQNQTLILSHAWLTYHLAGSGSETNEEEWMRVIENLTTNTPYNRNTELDRSIRDLAMAVEHRNEILPKLRNGEILSKGFLEVPFKEEVLKATLLGNKELWRSTLLAAERHPYLQGQLKGLLELSDVDGDDATDKSAHSRFTSIFTKFRLVHDTIQNDNQDHLVERALLCLGNILIRSSNKNFTFPYSKANETYNWRRVLRQEPAALTALGKLFKRIDSKGQLRLQLQKIVDKVKPDEAWRQLFVESPEAISLCEKRNVQFDGTTENELAILLKGTRRAEFWDLQSFVFWKILVGQFADNNLKGVYRSAWGNYDYPYIEITDSSASGSLRLASEAVGRFEVYFDQSDPPNSSDLAWALEKCIKVETDENEITWCSAYLSPIQILERLSIPSELWPC